MTFIVRQFIIPHLPFLYTYLYRYMVITMYLLIYKLAAIVPLILIFL